MAATLHLPMAASIPPSSSHPSRRSVRTLYSMKGGMSSKIPRVPLNPKDPFLSRLAHVAETAPEKLVRSDSDAPPFLDLFQSPQMAFSTDVERYSSYRGRKPRAGPPDLASILLDGRVVFIGMPLVPAVSELVISQLLYLEYMQPRAPINLYINSTGTSGGNGETVALESEGFAIYDVMMHLQSEVHTIALAAAIGHACLLLAAGKKGKRYMLPHATAMIQQYVVPPSGLMPASDVTIRAREAVRDRDTFVKLLAKHTGNSEQTVADKMKGLFYMHAKEAIEFGVIDEMLIQKQLKDMDILEARNRKLPGSLSIMLLLVSLFWFCFWGVLYGTMDL